MPGGVPRNTYQCGDGAWVAISGTTDNQVARILVLTGNDTEAHRSLSTIYFRIGRVAAGREQRKVAEAMDAAIQAQDQERGRNLKR